MLARDPQLVRKVRAAITAKIKPSSMILMESPHDPWRLVDFQLIEALQILEDELCPSCGNPVWVCRSNDPDLTWKVERSVCLGTRAVDERNWKKNNSGKRPSREDRDEWGSTLYPVPRMIEYPGEEPRELPSRDDYYKALSERVE